MATHSLITTTKNPLFTYRIHHSACIFCCCFRPGEKFHCTFIHSVCWANHEKPISNSMSFGQNEKFRVVRDKSGAEMKRRKKTVQTVKIDTETSAFGWLMLLSCEWRLCISASYCHLSLRSCSGTSYVIANAHGGARPTTVPFGMAMIYRLVAVRSQPKTPKTMRTLIQNSIGN